jgi:hypothetical protein
VKGGDPWYGGKRDKPEVQKTGTGV